jgi:nucleotide-binding universal stress UspA family protein
VILGEKEMFNRVVVGFDQSDGSRDALVLGRQLADRVGAEMVLVAVVPSPTGGSLIPALPGNAFTNLVAEAESGLSQAAEEFNASTELITSSSAARGLAELTETLHGDLLVLGCARAEAGRVRAGSKARVLMHGSTCAIALAPVGYRDNPGELSKVGAAVAGPNSENEEIVCSVESGCAIFAAVEVAGSGNDLKVISVADDYAENWGFWGASLSLTELGGASRRMARRILDKAMESVPEALKTEQVLLEGRVADQLRRQSEDLDILCMGSRGYGPIRRVLLGSVSSEVVDDAGCVLLVMPRH